MVVGRDEPAIPMIFDKLSLNLAAAEDAVTEADRLEPEALTTGGAELMLACEWLL